MIDLLKRLFTSSQSSDETGMEEMRQQVHGPSWSWGRAVERPYDHYTDAVEDIKQLKREKRHEEAEELLLWCIDYAEAEARAPNTVESTPAPAYYRHLGIVYRKDNRYDDEVQLLERYLNVCDELGGNPDQDLIDRLRRARELASET